MDRNLKVDALGTFAGGFAGSLFYNARWVTGGIMLVLAICLMAYNLRISSYYLDGWDDAIDQYDMVLAGRIDESERSGIYCAMTSGRADDDLQAELDLLECPSPEDIAATYRRHRRVD
jgi:hypothetical protein